MIVFSACVIQGEKFGSGVHQWNVLVEDYKRWAEVIDPACVYLVRDPITKETVDEHHRNGVLTHNIDYETFDTIDVSPPVYTEQDWNDLLSHPVRLVVTACLLFCHLYSHHLSMYPKAQNLGAFFARAVRACRCYPRSHRHIQCLF